MTYATDGVRDLLTVFYVHVFERQPDTDGLHFWWQKIIAGETFAIEALKAFNEHPEAKNPLRLEVSAPEPEPEKLEVLGGVGAIFRWSIWTHRQSGSLYSVSALGERITLDLDEVGAFNPGSRMQLPADNMLAIFEPVDPVEGSRWLDTHGANEGREGVAQRRERGNMVAFLYDGDKAPVKQHASAFGHRFREV